MAEQKKVSQAEKAASAAKSKQKVQSAGKQSSNKKEAVGKKDTKALQQAVQQPSGASRFVSCVIFAVLFVVFFVMAFNSEGALVRFVKNILLGIFGYTQFYISIPLWIYLFVIYAFDSDRPLKMRTVCSVLFVLCCGCIYHLALDPQQMNPGLLVLLDLYKGGIAGTSGGVICGLIVIAVRWLLGTVMSYILYAVLGILFLLAAFGITVPALIRAIKNRPTAQWEEEKRKPKQEPAQAVVNHIATKRIQYVEKRNEKIRVQQAEKRRNTPLTAEERLSDMMRQIGADTEEPVAAAVGGVIEEPLPPKRTKRRKAEKNIVDAEILPIQEQQTVISLPEPEEEAPAPSKMPPLEKNPVPVAVPQVVKPRKVTAREAEESAAQVAVEIAQTATEEVPEYNFPPIDLLKYPKDGAADGTAEMRENSRRLNETLASFKIEAHIINVTRGPTVTRYEVELEKGVRLSKLTTAADDIALSLGASGVRIAAVPGKISIVGIEVPNKAVTTVSLREVIDSPEFSKARSKSSFAVGKDIGGNCIVGNIAKLPHMLIAGTTGSGKSVCMNSIIISLLYKASPDDVKLIMIDPKMVELGIYNGIPHLLIPVVTDPKKAAGSLQWAVTEMMRRYKAMSDAGVRDLSSYNTIMEQEGNAKLPQVVVIIDELADLMLVAAKEVEESICRIAQMGRASGIHLVIATQRPSADVITGLMKANIPSRIAFAVASAMESRIILDTMGAEKLVGRGDMLFAPIGSGKPKRVQGCFVTDEEVEAVASFVKDNYSSTYDQDVMEEIEKKAAQTGTKNSAAAEVDPTDEETAGDEMLPAAVDVILETGQASVSMLQRRLKLGYARAARIVDEMEERGIVGPFQGSKPRAILITKEQWEQMRGGDTQLAFEDMDPENPAVEEEIF